MQYQYSKISHKDSTEIIHLLRLYTLCGISIDQALLNVAENKSEGTKNVLKSCSVGIQSGIAISEIFKNHHIVSEQESALLAAGEYAGYIGDAFKQIEYLRIQEQETKQIIFQACLYPVLIFILMSGLIAFLIFFIFPQIIPIFTSLKTSLPLSTRLLIFFHKQVLSHPIFILGAVFLTIGNIVLFRKKIKILVLRSMYFLLSRLPIINLCYFEYASALWARHISLMLERGIDMYEICISTKKITKHPLVVLISEKLLGYIKTGDQMYKAFDPLVVRFLSGKPIVSLCVSMGQIIKTGEETGTLLQCFAHISHFNEDNMRKRVKIITSILEPALLIAMGLCVGLVAYSMIAPIYQLTNTISHG